MSVKQILYYLSALYLFGAFIASLISVVPSLRFQQHVAVVSFMALSVVFLISGIFLTVKVNKNKNYEKELPKSFILGLKIFTVVSTVFILLVSAG